MNKSFLTRMSVDSYFIIAFIIIRDLSEISREGVGGGGGGNRGRVTTF